MSDEMNIREIQEILPQRYPFLLVDRVLFLEPGKKIVALKNVSINEPFFQGHFPGNPVMPGVLILEALAQAAMLLGKKSSPELQNRLLVLAAMEKVRFRKPIFPGDQLVLKAKVLKANRRFWSFQTQAQVAEEICAEAEITGMLAPAKI